jgi:hypothetical protein
VDDLIIFENLQFYQIEKKKKKKEEDIHAQCTQNYVFVHEKSSSVEPAERTSGNEIGHQA